MTAATGNHDWATRPCGSHHSAAAHSGECRSPSGSAARESLWHLVRIEPHRQTTPYRATDRSRPPRPSCWSELTSPATGRQAASRLCRGREPPCSVSLSCLCLGLWVCCRVLFFVCLCFLCVL